MTAAAPWLLVAWSMPSLATIATSICLTVLVIGLVVLICTRWGQTQPMNKCIALSLLAHLLLAIYAFCTHVLFHNPAAVQGYQKVVNVRLEDAVGTDEMIPATALDDPDAEPSDEVVLLQPQPEPVISEAPSAAPALLLPKPKEVPELPESKEPEPEAVQPMATAVAEATPMPAEGAVAQPQPMPSPPQTVPAPTTNVATTTQPIRAADGSPLPAAFSARVSDHDAQLSKYGGNANTEQAVKAALEWLARNQSADGSWDPARFGAGRETKTLGHDRGGCGAKAHTGISALAILAFLGSGETHLTGPHRENVQHGLEFLIASQAADGNLAGKAEFFAAMYCHSMSLLALGEAYGMTGDERLEPAIIKAVNFSVQSQHSTGSWRYRPQETGDMSQFGWQAMALRSVQIGKIKVAAETTARMKLFLDRCSLGPARGLASYRPGDGPSRTMTAEALVCRYFLQASNAPAALAEAADYVGEELPSGKPNFYYWYYGTVAMFQRGGKDWDKWNEALKPALLNSQRSDGDLVGSWDPDIYWGGYGGRVYSTALGALCLETYYRHLPVILDDDERELRWTKLPKETPK